MILGNSNRRFSGVTERFARRFESLPQESIWEMQLMLHDLEQRPVVQTNTASLATFADSSARLATSSERLATTAESLPEDVRAELDQALDSIDLRQAELQRTLEQARATLSDASSVVDQADALVADVDGMTASLDRTASGLATAGESWEGAVRAYHEMVADLYPPGEEPETPPDPDGKPFDILDWAKTAEEIGGAAGELRGAITELHELLASDALDTGANRVETAAKKATDAAAESAVDVVDHAAWRGLQLLIAAFVLALVYRFVSGRWMSRKA